MKILSKRLVEEKKKIKNRFLYDIKTGIQLLKSTASAKFNETIEVHVSLNIDKKHSDQAIRTTVILPHGTGKNLCIATLVSPENFSEAHKAGSDIYGYDDLIENIKKNIINFDLLITTPDMMPKLVKLGRILGPKKLMPSPKMGTVTENIKNTIKEFKKGKIEYRTDKNYIVHMIVGKANFSEEQLLENMYTFFNSLELNKPLLVKGNFIKKITLCSTMGPGININYKTFY
jgi:large subunit ribosomal protein L1